MHLRTSIFWWLSARALLNSGLRKARTGRVHERQLILASSLFDGSWYRDKYPDVLVADLDPAKHYLESGARESRDPGPLFNTHWYLVKYPDVAGSGMNPLVHYLKYGSDEQRLTSLDHELVNSFRFLIEIGIWLNTQTSAQPALNL